MQPKNTVVTGVGFLFVASVSGVGKCFVCINVSIVVALEKTHSRYFLSSRKLSGDHKLVALVWSKSL